MSTLFTLATHRAVARQDTFWRTVVAHARLAAAVT